MGWLKPIAWLTTIYSIHSIQQEKVKIQTINNELLIYLDEIALAYRAMVEGAWTKSGFIYIKRIYNFRNISI